MQTKLLILVLLFIVNQFTGISSSNANPKTPSEIIIRNSKGTICTWVSADKRRINLKTDRFYYGYHLNELFFKQGVLQGKPLNGTFDRYDRDGNIIESGHFKYGLKHGLWKQLSPKGYITQTEEYRNGMLCGKRVVYKNGMPEFQEHYRKGHLIGKSKLLNPLPKPPKAEAKHVKKKNQLQQPIENKGSEVKADAGLKGQKIKKMLQRYKCNKKVNNN